MSPAWTGFICGLILGSFATIFVLAVCKAAGDADRGYYGEEEI